MWAYTWSQHMALLDEQAVLCLMLTLAKATAALASHPTSVGMPVLAKGWMFW